MKRLSEKRFQQNLQSDADEDDTGDESCPFDKVSADLFPGQGRDGRKKKCDSSDQKKHDLGF